MVGAGGLSAEVCKNLVLAGIASLRLMDEGTVRPNSLGANFFCTAADVGAKVGACGSYGNASGARLGGWLLT